MNILRATVTLGFGAMLIAACGDDSGSVALKKGVVDQDALESGVTVTLSGSQGTVRVPFMEPVPEVSDDDLQAELAASVSLQVQSDASGATANLAAGTIVDGSPTQAGEWSWQLNDDRDEATMTFFNRTPGNLTLKSGSTYAATMSITTNDYIERVTAFTTRVTVTGG